MTKPLSLQSIAISGAMSLLLLAAAAGPASADSSAAASKCTTPQLSQPFLAWGDDDWYAPVPGESADDFAGSGWSLEGGASIATAALADGTSGSVLNLPGGAFAISPPVCVESDYTTARTLIESDNGASVAVAQSADGSAGPHIDGLISADGSGWSLSDPLALTPSDSTGWKTIRFVIADVTPGGHAQLYDFELDPRMSD